MQHILITGGNAGIGKATAIALAQKGSTIIIACRNKIKAEEAVEEIKSATKNQNVYQIECDLASFNSIRTCAENYTNQFGQLDVLINNAGLVTDKLQFTKDGLELQIGVNHFGHFLLTNLLIDLFKKAKDPRIINVSSNAHFKGKINLNTFRGEIGHKKYNGLAAYSQSKVANVLFTKELARRYPFICSHCVHPGVVRTNIAAKNKNGILWKIGWKILSPVMLTPQKGAKTSIFLATSSEPLKANGLYFKECNSIEPAEVTQDETLAKQLWEISEKLVK